MFALRRLLRQAEVFPVGHPDRDKAYEAEVPDPRKVLECANNVLLEVVRNAARKRVGTKLKWGFTPPTGSADITRPFDDTVTRNAIRAVQNLQQMFEDRHMVHLKHAAMMRQMKDGDLIPAARALLQHVLLELGPEGGFGADHPEVRPLHCRRCLVWLCHLTAGGGRRCRKTPPRSGLHACCCARWVRG